MTALDAQVQEKCDFPQPLEAATTENRFFFFTNKSENTSDCPLWSRTSKGSPQKSFGIVQRVFVVRLELNLREIHREVIEDWHGDFHVRDFAIGVIEDESLTGGRYMK